jgi:hypothetical protein
MLLQPGAPPPNKAMLPTWHAASQARQRAPREIARALGRRR